VIRLLSIIHNGIILDLVCRGFSVECSVLSSFPQWAESLQLYSLLSVSGGSSREPSLLILSREFRPLVKTPKPHRPGSRNLIGPGRSNNKPTDPRTT